MTAPILFFDIAGPAELNLASFYTKVFGWEADQAGQFAVTITPPLRGAFRPDPAEKRIYVGVADVTATLATVVEAGGKIDAPRFEVPGVVVLGLFRDPAGNEMGLVEMIDDRPRVP
jgi:predicted enzyme related to lactoylglutathione lyase